MTWSLGGLLDIKDRINLDQELRGEGIRVFAVHPGQLRTSVGAMDADTDPEAAARALVHRAPAIASNKV